MALPSELTGFLTKKELSVAKTRDKRTIGKDIADALEQGDLELLKLTCLYLKSSNKILPGTAPEINKDYIQELTRQGENPEWYLREEFVDLVRKRRRRKTSPTSDNSFDQENQEDTQRSQSNTSSRSEELGEQPLPLPEDPKVRGIVSEHLLVQERIHQSNINKLTEQLIALTEQSNILMARFQDMKLPPMSAEKGEKASGDKNSAQKPDPIPVELLNSKDSSNRPDDEDSANTDASNGPAGSDSKNNSATSQSKGTAESTSKKTNKPTTAKRSKPAKKRPVKGKVVKKQNAPKQVSAKTKTEQPSNGFLSGVRSFLFGDNDQK